ncbi:MAG TPA: GyrI-like domain-containing protein [Patescibacteria group bacterium]|nr:GyrI-like domain-containing protein [Patescibacteria group bacterium]
MEKIDFKKELAALYSPKNTEFKLVEVPRMNFLMIDGQGDPNTARDYSDAVEALYSVAYAIKFMSKRTLEKDYIVAPLEGLWTADDLSVFENAKKDQYQWTMMIMQPDWVTKEMVAEAIESTKAKKQLPALPKIRFEAYAEGKSLQLLHVGSYDDEAPKLKYLHNEFMPANHLSINGNHHEIYLSDPRKTATDKLKTILRQPVKS